METDNSFNFTKKQVKTIACARGITAGVCGVILLLVFVVLVILSIRPRSRDRMCGSVKKRLTIWLTAVTVLPELTQFLSLMYFLNKSDTIFFDYIAFCRADGFLNQYFGTVQLFFTLSISFTFFFEVCEATLNPRCIQNLNINEDSRCCGCKKKTLLEVGLCFVMFIIPILYAVLFATDTYSTIGPWCWNLSIAENCDERTAGPHVLLE